eukprot:scaffold11465_cov105-Isochrysis_galbana.AAC.7
MAVQVQMRAHPSGETGAPGRKPAHQGRRQDLRDGREAAQCRDAAGEAAQVSRDKAQGPHAVLGDGAELHGNHAAH